MDAHKYLYLLKQSISPEIVNLNAKEKLILNSHMQSLLLDSSEPELFVNENCESKKRSTIPLDLNFLHCW